MAMLWFWPINKQTIDLFDSNVKFKNLFKNMIRLFFYLSETGGGDACEDGGVNIWIMNI